MGKREIPAPLTEREGCRRDVASQISIIWGDRALVWPARQVVEWRCALRVIIRKAFK